MSSDNQFTALGPAIIGFQTNSASIDRGAEIHGRDVGVAGHCDNGPGVSGESRNFIGVFGQSINHVGVRGASTTRAGVEGISSAVQGVFGMGTPGVLGSGVKNGTTGHNGIMGIVEGNDGAGVFGGHRNPTTAPAPPPLDVTSFDPADSPGAGVFGVSNDDGNGVVGRSRFGHGVAGSSRGGVDFTSHGVFGASAQTAGVVGISGPVPDINATIPPGHSGVYGFCAQGRGVFGSSEDEEGVRGSSKNGYGGLFVSEKLAQVHLDPLDIFKLLQTVIQMVLLQAEEAIFLLPSIQGKDLDVVAFGFALESIPIRTRLNGCSWRRSEREQARCDRAHDFLPTYSMPNLPVQLQCVWLHAI